MPQPRVTFAKSHEKGFTLVETLVVSVIIGILAAIAIPAFLNQRKEAWRAEVYSDLKNATIATATYLSTTGGDPEDLTIDSIANYGFNTSENITLTVNVTGADYTLSATHTNLPGTWTINSTASQITYTN